MEEGVDEVIEGGVFEAAFEAFCEGGADCEGDDYVVGVFGGAVGGLVNIGIWLELGAIKVGGRDVHCGEAALGGGEVIENGVKSFGCHFGREV